MPDEKVLRELYRLSGNPFSQRSRPDAPIVGRKAEQEAWTAILDSAVGSRGCSLNFIEGDYGLGKTHSLFHINTLANARKDAAGVFVKLMKEDPIKNFGLDFVRRVFKGLPDEALARIAKAKAATAGIRLEHLPHFNVITRFATRTSPYHEVLIGAEAKAAEINKANIRRLPKSAEVMFEYLTVLLVMMHSVGIRTLVLCVDEAEYIFSQLTQRKAAPVFNAIRAMYDLPDTHGLGLGYNIANMVLFFAFSVAGAGSLKRMEKVEAQQGGPIQPLLSRLNRTISLTFLSEAETKDLVKEYLHLDRVTGAKRQDPLIPYDASFVDYVYALTKGHPREVINRCSYVLEEGLRDRTPALTRAYARTVFERLGLPR